MEKRTYRAVFFDLDGTLLPMDVDAFMKRYFAALGGYVARMGIATDQFMAGMKRGITAMATNDTGHANAESFWPEFLAAIDLPDGVTPDALTDAITDFYENEFGKLGEDVKPNPAAARAINALAAKGYPLVLATMPMFPRRAVEWRLTWAGVDPAAFARITTYENSTAVKPKPNYYAENLAAVGVDGRDVLMVGNNTKEDLAVCQLGCDAFLVTDFLIDPVGFEVFSVRHGSLEKFADWVETLPVCGDPAQGVNDALVPAAARERALAANGIEDGAAGGAKTLEEAGRSGGANFVINGMED